MNDMPRRHQEVSPQRHPPAVIEDEPAHEFYATVCGRRGELPPSRRSKRNAILLPPPIAAAAARPLDTSESGERSGRGGTAAAARARNGRAGGSPRRSPPPSPVPIVALVPSDGDDGGGSSDGGESGGPAGRGTGGRSEMALALHRAFSDPPRLSSLSLDRTSCPRGYGMLARMGWTEDGGGLGKRRQGTLEPVKTRLKRDRKGLGCDGGGKRGEGGEERVTHVHWKEIEAKRARRDEGVAGNSTGGERQGTKQGTTNAKRRHEAELEAMQERRARMLLRSDIAAEHEDLYMRLYF